MSDDKKQTACLYVLGLLPEHEAAAFEREMAADTELQQLTGSLNNALVAVARSTPLQSPPEVLKNRILESLAPPAAESASPAGTVTPSPLAESTPAPGAAPASPKPSPPRRAPMVLPKEDPSPETDAGSGSVASKPKAKSAFSLLPWGLAAGLAIAAGLLWKNWQTEADAVRTEKDRNARMAHTSSQSLADATLREAKLKQQVAELTKQAEDQRTAGEKQMTDAAQKLKEASDALAAVQERVTQLEQLARVDQARVAVLSSKLANRPKAVAVSVWNQAQQDGILVVENLPVLPPGRDYQLWVIDPAAGGPVSAGVFKVDAAGKVRIQFKPDKAIQKPDAFAVTEEKEGGVPAPTLTKMVVSGS